MLKSKTRNEINFERLCLAKKLTKLTELPLMPYAKSVDAIRTYAVR